MKRVLALVLSLCLVLALTPAVFAAESGNVSVKGNAYNTVEEALAAAAAGDTITLNADLTAGQIIVPQGVALDLNGYTLTAGMVIVFNGQIGGGNVVVGKDMLKVIGDNAGNLPVWNGEGYTFVSVKYQQMINVAEDLSSAKYIFIPNFDLDTLALLADGGADNGISVKVLMTWNGGVSEQYYTFSDELVAQVYSSANANGVCSKVFQLTVTGITGIEDMTVCAIVESAAGVKVLNDASKVALPEPEPEPDPEPDPEPEVVEKELVLTVDSLGLPSQSYTASTATVSGVGFEWVQLGNYDAGIQVRDKDGKTSMLWNTTAFGQGIKEIRMVFNSTKSTYNNPDAEIFSFGNAMNDYTYTTKLSTTSGVKEYVITPDADTYTYFYFEHDLGFTMYWDSITIVYADVAGGSEPVEPEDPTPEEPTPDEPTPEEPTPDVPADSVLTVEEAIALGASKDHNTYTEDKYYVTGVITEVYNTTYGNMKITDEAGNILTVYGTYSADGQTRYDALTVKPVVGDTVTVYGIIGQYNGTPQVKNGWITEHTPGEGGTTEPEEPTPDPEVPADPEADTALSIEAAIALGASKAHNTYTTGKYYVTGVITEVYGTQYGNMRITDDAGNILTVYGTYSADGKIRYDAMEVQPVAGDTITVYGIIGQYNSTPQMKNGWLIEHIPAEGGTTEPEEPTPDPEPEPEPDVPAEPEAPAETTASKTIAELITEYGWTSTTTKQAFALDDVVSVKINGGSNTGKAYNGDHIRIYATDSPAGTITISVAEGYELVSIKITTVTGTYAFLCVDGTTVDISNTAVTVSGTSVVLNSVKNGTDGKQVRVTAIEVTYK